MSSIPQINDDSLRWHIVHELNGFVNTMLIHLKDGLKNEDFGRIDEAKDIAEVIQTMISHLYVSQIKTNPKLVKEDLDSSNGVTFSKLIVLAIRSAFYSMFNFTANYKISEIYFPNKEDYLTAHECVCKINVHDLICLSDTIRTVCFPNSKDMVFYCDDESILTRLVGNEYHTQTLLIVLLQEIMYNAFKNAAGVDKNSRTLSMKIINKKVTITNSYNQDFHVVSCNLGRKVINEISQHLGIEVLEEVDDNSYIVSFDLPF